MAKYLLRVEGVNLANVIDDTDQLSELSLAHGTFGVDAVWVAASQDRSVATRAEK